MQGRVKFIVLGFLLFISVLGLSLLQQKKNLFSLIPIKLNKDNSDKLKSGMSKNEVLGIMGVPYKTEVYLLGNRAIEFLFYKKRLNIFSINNNDFLPVAIDSQSGVVISIEKKFYEQLMNETFKK